MPALITTVIPAQGFEVVRDAIGVILTLELNNQKALQGFSEAITIYSERMSPMQEEENLYFNILLDSAAYNNFTQVDAQGLTNYFIDIYTVGKNNTGTNTPGFVDSGYRLHKFMGMVRAILADTHYNTLGLALGLIGGTYVESFATSEPTPFQDGSYSRIGRIKFSVRIRENQTLWQGVSLLGEDTSVSLDETDLGYVYSYTG